MFYPPLPHLPWTISFFLLILPTQIAPSDSPMSYPHVFLAMIPSSSNEDMPFWSGETSKDQTTHVISPISVATSRIWLGGTYHTFSLKFQGYVNWCLLWFLYIFIWHPPRHRYLKWGHWPMALTGRPWCMAAWCWPQPAPPGQYTSSRATVAPRGGKPPSGCCPGHLRSGTESPRTPDIWALRKSYLGPKYHKGITSHNWGKFMVWGMIWNHHILLTRFPNGATPVFSVLEKNKNYVGVSINGGSPKWMVYQ